MKIRGFLREPPVSFIHTCMATPPKRQNPFEGSNFVAGMTSGRESAAKESVLDRQPSSQNYIYPPYFQFIVAALPQMTYFTTKAALPDFGYDSALIQDNRFAQIKHPASKVGFANLDISFLVDEDMGNWREISDWIKRTTVVNDHFDIDPNDKDHFCDGTLIITNSAMQPNVEVTFRNMFPISITGFQFDSSVTELTPFESTATFAYDYYEVKKI